MFNKIVILFFISINNISFSQESFPWQSALMMALSADGSNFNNHKIFQDSAEMPSLVKWHGDTMACSFQWFQQPIHSTKWDKIAIKFSFNQGITWTNTSPIQIIGLPIHIQSPYNPMLEVINKDSLRLYFSSKDGMQNRFSDSSYKIYSAVGIDGIHYQFENNIQLQNSIQNNKVQKFNDSNHLQEFLYLKDKISTISMTNNGNYIAIYNSDKNNISAINSERPIVVNQKKKSFTTYFLKYIHENVNMYLFLKKYNKSF